MPMVARSWNGLEIEAKINRAAGRAIVGIALVAAVETKKVTHVLSGTLRRSVHAATVGEFHDDDENAAQGGQDLSIGTEAHAVSIGGVAQVVEVGSWISYACVEWVGRMHPGVTQGVEMARGARADAIVAQAFREEGL